MTDVDAFNLASGAGTLQINVRTVPDGPTLDATVRVIDPFGTVIGQGATTGGPAGGLGESLNFAVGGGNYTILVSSAGSYGDLGQYTLDVDAPQGAVSTDHYLVESTEFDDIITINLVEGAYELDVNGQVTTLDPDTIKFFDILPGDGNDTITIGPGVCGAYVLGGSGDDTITGGDANDILSGSAGNDLIFGGSGDDRLGGGNGRDYLVAGNGYDRAYGDAGNDVITGGAGVDRLFGGSENDVLSGESSADKMYGDAGNDTIYGGRGTDLLNGGDGIDQFWGGDDDDYIYSRDVVIELVNGGAGFDRAQVDEAPDHDIRQSLEEYLA
jgi:Ca2+-binding RTX toxin-like protein